jgi:hypothetical protein
MNPCSGDFNVDATGDPARGLPMIAVENPVLRRWTGGPPSPRVIRTTDWNRVSNELPRTPVAIGAAPALGAPPDAIYPLR